MKKTAKTIVSIFIFLLTAIFAQNKIVVLDAFCLATDG